MLSNVVALVYDGVGAFGLGVVSEVFGYDRSADGLPAYEFAVVAERPGPVRTDTGLQVVAGPDPEDDRVLFAQLLTSFTERLPDVLRDLRLAADQGDAGAVERHAHGLKGSAANLGARHLAAASALVEAEARNGCASLPEEMQQLRDEVGRTIRAVSALTRQ